jgi:hypothetical protein
MERSCFANMGISLPGCTTSSGIIKDLRTRLSVPLKMIGNGTAVVQKRERLSGLLNYYYREAA